MGSSHVYFPCVCITWKVREIVTKAVEEEDEELALVRQIQKERESAENEELSAMGMRGKKGDHKPGLTLHEERLV